MNNSTIKTQENVANYDDFVSFVDQLYYPGWAAQMAEENKEALNFEYESYLDLMNLRSDFLTSMFS